MPPKKKKGKKKKAKKEDKDKDPDAEKPKLLNEKPDYIDPKRDAPVAKITLQLASPFLPYLNSVWEAPVSTRLYMLFRKIQAMHGGSIENISVCL